MPQDSRRCFGRREVLAILGAGALAAGRAARAAGSAFRFTSLDHVALAVSDVPGALKFYARVFGNTVLKEQQNPRRYLRLGPCYVAIAPPGRGQESHAVNHFCPGIASFQLEEAKRTLDQLGIAYREATGVGLFVPDPDGIQVQLWTENSWSQLGRTASPETVPAGAPLLRPTGIDHILLNVSDPEKSEPFYEKLFGPVAQRNNNRTWFRAGKSRVGLLRAAAGERPGVNHFCLSAEAFDSSAVVKPLEESGARVQPSDAKDAIEFRDPEGILVQITPPHQA